MPPFLLGSAGRLTVRVVAAGLEAVLSRYETAPTTAHGEHPGPGAARDRDRDRP
ncbi:hypothetical protein [Kitasatospora sp. NPDC005751]|uniref:hypothetical protein n=1 Tax=Kitasatospora sp. NPDC005751 TaxID=3157064 RepID=UPI0033D07990